MWHWAIREGSKTIYEETARYEKFIIQQTTSSVGFATLGIAALAPRPSILLQSRFWSGVSQFKWFFFEIRSVLGTRGHPFKLFKSRCSSNIRSTFFAERVINMWKSLPSTVNVFTLALFRRTFHNVDFSRVLKCT